MRLIRLSVDDNYQSPVASAVAIGNFDGLHLGHQAVIDAMLIEAKLRGLEPSVLTFEPHPRRYFSKAKQAFRLQTLGEKLRLLRDAGVKQVFLARFNAALSGLHAEAFVHQILHQKLAARHVVTGTNFAFGKARTGNAALLTRLLTSYSATHAQIAPVKVGHSVCSSTAIREALEDSDMQKAACLLGRPYLLSGRVQHGDKRGRLLGYPTANLHFSPELLLPKFGIYAVRTNKGDGVANLGIRPMYRSASPLLEVHLFDVNADLYGQMLQVECVQRLRGEEHFSSEQELVEQMASDCNLARKLLG
ncbi:MAG: bifunctional riboflavin kinase/FAD synthetase [Alphaproteobacteria bacterium]|nr:bifunctional riboflavin kinase/FAD synthetase [Alphaproteobacteria bacterium]